MFPERDLFRLRLPVDGVYLYLMLSAGDQPRQLLGCRLPVLHLDLWPLATLGGQDNPVARDPTLRLDPGQLDGAGGGLGLGVLDLVAMGFW